MPDDRRSMVGVKVSGFDVLTEAVLRALPVGVLAFGPDQRLLLANPAYCESVKMPADSFARGTSLEDILRNGAYRGALGPGDPEEQVAEALRIDYSRPQRLQRRHFDGRTFDVHSAPVQGGGHVVCAVETTQVLAARDEAETVVARISTAVSSLRIGLAMFSADRRLLLHNPRFAELLGLSPAVLERGVGFTELVGKLRTSGEFAGPEDEAFLAAQLVLDRSRPSGLRRMRANGQLTDLASDPLADGGWTMTITDISPLARAQDESRRRATMLDSILACIPHGVCVYGPDRRLTLVNPAYSDIMRGAPVAVGDSLESVIRRRAAAGEFGPGDPAEIARQQLGFDISKPQMRRRRRPNGTTIEIRTAPLPDGGHISVVTDVTPLMQAEDEVSRRVTEMDLMLANIRHGIILFGPDHRVIASNRVAAELLNQRPELLKPGRSHAELLEHMRARAALEGRPEGSGAGNRGCWTRLTDPKSFAAPLKGGACSRYAPTPLPGAASS